MHSLMPLLTILLLTHVHSISTTHQHDLYKAYQEKGPKKVWRERWQRETKNKSQGHKHDTCTSMRSFSPQTKSRISLKRQIRETPKLHHRESLQLFLKNHKKTSSE